MLNELQRFNFENPRLSPEVAEAIPKLFEGYSDSLVAAAVSAEKRAEHWDKDRPKRMHVGCSILVLGKNLDLSQPAIYTGANFKPNPGDLPYPDRKCSEMNAFENILGVQYSGKIEAEKYEEMEGKDLGFIVAIITTSEAHNTQESDTADHDVVYPCKQCQTNYKFLLEKGIVSEKTIIYNLRTKDGKPEAGEPMELGKLLEKFAKGEEERNLKSIADMLAVQKNALTDYREAIKNIENRFGRPDEIVDIPANLDDKPYRRTLYRERDHAEAVLEEKGIYAGTVINALKSALEEGVSKERLIKSLGLTRVVIEPNSKGFNKSELEQMSQELALRLSEAPLPYIQR